MLDIHSLLTNVTQLQRLLIAEHGIVATQRLDLRTQQRLIDQSARSRKARPSLGRSIMRSTTGTRLQRYTQDGRLEMDNNIAECSVRSIGIGRKNFLFFGSDTVGERAALIYSLIETYKLNHIDPQRYLHYLLECIAVHPITRIEELLPWNVVNKLDQPQQVADALAA